MEFNGKAKILCGKNAIDQIPFELNFLKSTAPCLIMDDAAYRRGNHRTILKTFKNERLMIALFGPRLKNDAYEKAKVESFAVEFANKQCDSILVVGGKGALNFANAVKEELERSFKLHEEAELENRKTIPLLYVPVMFGDGAEHLGKVLLLDEKNEMRISNGGSDAFPGFIFLDARLSRNVRKPDAQRHYFSAVFFAAEAYIRNSDNLYGRVYAEAALAALSDDYQKICKNFLCGIDANKVAESRIYSATSMQQSESYVIRLAEMMSGLSGLSLADTLLAVFEPYLHFSGRADAEVIGNILSILTKQEVGLDTEKQIRHFFVFCRRVSMPMRKKIRNQLRKISKYELINQVKMLRLQKIDLKIPLEFIEFLYLSNWTSAHFDAGRRGHAHPMHPAHMHAMHHHARSRRGFQAFHPEDAVEAEETKSNDPQEKDKK